MEGRPSMPLAILRRQHARQKPQPKVAPPAARPARVRAATSLPHARASLAHWAASVVAPRQDRLFTYALGLSIAIHAVALAIRFQPFDLRAMLDRGPPLEVALVNAKTKAKPTKADILAQANLDGGGNTDADRRAKTPLPVVPKNSRDREIAVATQKVDVLERQAKELLTQLQSVPVPTPAPAPLETSDKSELPTANELMQRTLEVIRLEAQIAKEMDAYQKRPKRKFVGARAEEYRFARYVEDWRLKVERVGNLNYPEAARQLQLYGNLLLSVAIRADGSVESVRVQRSSGQKVLDAAAVRIVEMAGPYAPLPPDIRRDTDILEITRTWTFAKGDELRSD
jgi:protein TonB